MTDPQLFPDLIRRLRAGDAAAAERLVRDFEPVIRLEVRVRMTDPGLKRLLDSLDVCQSVLASFFVRAAAGQYDLDEPGQLVRVLVTIARNKLASAARAQHRLRRDARRVAEGADAAELAAADPSPSRLAAGRELLHEVRVRLTSEERAIADLRAEGYNWPEIVTRLGGTAEARRKQLTRALDRVTQELGLEGLGDDP